MSIYSEIFSAIVGAFNGLRLSSGEILQSSGFKGEKTPRLLWKIGGWKSENWQPFKYRVTWNVPAELLVQGEAGSQYTALDALGDLYDQADRIYGLPVNKDGVVVEVGPKQDELLSKGGLFSIADRFVGPYILSATPKPGEGDSSFTAVDLMFGMEFVVDSTPAAKSRAMFFTLGVNPDNADHTGILRDPSRPFGYPLDPVADTRSQGAYAKPDTTLKIGGQVVYASDPPIVQNIPAVEGIDPANTLVSIAIEPISATVTASTQLQCIATAYDGGTFNITNGAAWSSSAPAVATVNSTGMVTKVSGGSATITATFNGFSATCAVTTA